MPTEARVRDLLGRLTLEEKVAQLQSRGTFPPFLPTGTLKRARYRGAVMGTSGLN